MTEEKKKLVEDNIKLAGWACSKFYGYVENGTFEREELYSMCLMALVISANKYDASRGSFSTIYFLNAKREVYHALRTKSKLVREVDSVDNDDFYHEPSTCTNMEDSVAVEQFLSVLDEREKEIVKLSYGIGCIPVNQKDIGNMFGVSQAQISRMISKSIEKMKKII